MDGTAYHEHRAHLIDPETARTYVDGRVSRQLAPKQFNPDMGIGIEYDIYGINSLEHPVYKSEGRLYVTVSANSGAYSGQFYTMGVTGRYFHQKLDLRGVLSYLPLSDNKVDISISDLGTRYEGSLPFYGKRYT